MRIFPAKGLRLACYAMLSIVSTYWMIAVLFAFLNCRPFAYTWARSQGVKGSCADKQGGTLGFGIVNLIFDIAVIIIPFPYLYTLKLQLHKKISLMVIFTLGFVITAISAVRIHSIVSSYSKDMSYGAAEINLWSFLETSLSVINCCLPTIRPALVAITRTSNSLFTHQTSEEPSLPTHKFITLTFDSSQDVVHSGAPSPMPAERPMSMLERKIHTSDDASQAKKQNHWKTKFCEQTNEVSEEDCSMKSVRATKARDQSPPLPPHARNIEVKSEWIVEHVHKAHR